MSPMRSFDPRAVGGFECRAWEPYCRRDWAAGLLASVRMVRTAFRMSWPRTLRGAWLGLRANQKCAPIPGGGAGADAEVRRALLAKEPSARFDPTRAAELEVEWWRARGAHQGAGSVTTSPPLAERQEGRVLDPG